MTIFQVLTDSEPAETPPAKTETPPTAPDGTRTGLTRDEVAAIAAEAARKALDEDVDDGDDGDDDETPPPSLT